MKHPIRLFVALGSPPPAFMNDSAMTQPLTVIVWMINPIKKESENHMPWQLSTWKEHVSYVT